MTLFPDSFLCNNKHVFCAEAQIITALILLKKEKDVTVMTFTADGTKLKLVPFTAETSFEKAMDIYEKGMVSLLVERGTVD